MPLNKPTIAVVGPRITVAALLFGLLATGGCDRGDDSFAVIVKARATLASIGASGTAAPTAARARAYQDVISAMQAVGGSGGSAVTSATAKVITAQATMGQGEIAAAAQREAEGEVARLTAVARVLSEQFIKGESLAASLEGHDQSSMIAAQRQMVAQLEDAHAIANARREQNEAALTQLNAKAAERGGMAKRSREVAGQLRAALADVQGEARLPMVEEAAKHLREADRFEVEQSHLELEAQSMAALVESARQAALQLSRQKELTLESVKRIEESAALLKAQSAVARAKSAETAVALSAAFEEALSAVEQTLKPAYADASGKYNAASSLAAAGSAADAALSKAMSGSAQQALASVHASFAASLEGVADVASRIGSQKGLPFAGKGHQVAMDLMEEIKAARGAGASATAQAGASFQSANPKGPSADAFKRIGDRLSPPVDAVPEAPVSDAPSPEAAPDAAPTEDAPPAEMPAEAPPETPQNGEPAPDPA